MIKTGKDRNYPADLSWTFRWLSEPKCVIRINWECLASTYLLGWRWGRTFGLGCLRVSWSSRQVWGGQKGCSFGCEERHLGWPQGNSSKLWWLRRGKQGLAQAIAWATPLQCHVKACGVWSDRLRWWFPFSKRGTGGCAPSGYHITQAQWGFYPGRETVEWLFTLAGLLSMNVGVLGRA